MKELETSRCILRHLREGDAQTIYDNWASDPSVTEYLTWKPHESVDETKRILNIWLADYKNANCFRYGIELKENNDLIGMIDAAHFLEGVPVVGYVLARKYWGHGIMTECLGALKKELFANGYDSVEVRAADKNIGSNRVILKNGFYCTGSRRLKISDANPKVELINYYRADRSR